MSLDLDLSWTKIMIQTYMVHIFFIGVYPQLSTHEDSDLSTTLFKDQEMMRGNNNLLKVFKQKFNFLRLRSRSKGKSDRNRSNQENSLYVTGRLFFMFFLHSNNNIITEAWEWHQKCSVCMCVHPVHYTMRCFWHPSNILLCHFQFPSSILQLLSQHPVIR